MSMGAHTTDSNRLVQDGFFEPLGPKWKYSEEKIHFFTSLLKSKFQVVCQPTNKACLTEFIYHSIIGSIQATGYMSCPSQKM